MNKRLDLTKLAFAAVIAALVLFVCVNIVVNNWFGNVRADFTQGHSYSTSDQIRPIFQNISEPIIVRLYYSEAVGQASQRHALYYQRVRDLLQQYAKLSKGQIKIELYNPEPFSDVEDRAVGFGLRGIPISQNGEVGYFGLAATNSTDDQQVIPFFSIEREQFLEYDLTKLIYNLARPRQPRIGVISSLQLDGGMSKMQQQMGDGRPSPPWAIMQQIREFFTVVQIDPETKQIPQSIDMLLLAQPDKLSQQAQIAIDQYVLNGGKVLLFVDPFAESSNPMGSMSAMAMPEKPDLSGIKRLMAAWGVKLVDEKVVGDLDAAMRVNLSANGRPIVSDFVAWLQLTPGDFDPSDAVTGDLKQINLGTPGAIEAVKDAGTTITPLILTGPRSMLIDADKFAGVPDIIGLFRDFKPENKREVLAARVTGLAKTAFPENPSVQLKQAKQPIQVIVVADTDILTDRFWVQSQDMMGQQVIMPTSDNGNFVANAMENLTGAPALSSLRGRGVRSRPFTLLDGIRRDAEMQYRAKEQDLTSHLEELEKKAGAMQEKHDSAGNAVLSDADKKVIDSYRGEILATRRELRDVQRALRENIDRLEKAITFANIGAVPIIFGLILIAVAVIRHRRRQRRASDV